MPGDILIVLVAAGWVATMLFLLERTPRELLDVITEVVIPVPAWVAVRLRDFFRSIGKP